MSKNRKKENPKKEQRRKLIANVAIVISLVILMIPVAFLGVTGIQSMMGRGKPIFGRRFANDHKPEIKDKQLDEIQNLIKGIEGIEDVEVNLQSATLRIYALDESLSEDSLRDKQEIIYELVGSVLNVEDYFTSHDGQKQYDLEIHLYNIDDVTEDNMSDYVYGIYVKNANMQKPYSQILTTPQSQEMVDFFIEEEEYYNKLEEEGDKEDSVDEIDDVEIGEGDEE